MIPVFLSVLLAVALPVRDTLPAATVRAFKDNLPVEKLASPVSNIRVDEAAIPDQAEL